MVCRRPEADRFCDASCAHNKIASLALPTHVYKLFSSSSDTFIAVTISKYGTVASIGELKTGMALAQVYTNSRSNSLRLPHFRRKASSDSQVDGSSHFAFVTLITGHTARGVSQLIQALVLGGLALPAGIEPYFSKMHGLLAGRLPDTSDLVHQACPAHGQYGQRRRGTWRAFAMASRQANKQAPRQSRKRAELPETGYFAQADPSGKAAQAAGRLGC